MDNYSFDIFVPEKKKKNLKGVIKMFVSFLLVTFVSYVCFELQFFKNNTYYYIFITVLATIVAYYNGFFKKTTIKQSGSFQGKITFSKKGIKIRDNFFPVENLYSIIIDNNDYKGKNLKEFGEFESDNKSSGVNNILTVKTNTNKFFEVYFLQNSRDEFYKIENLLILYYKHNLLTDKDIINILNYKSDIDKIELRKKLK